MKIFNSFVLDDEETGLKATLYFLKKLPFIRIVSTATNLEEAEKEILFHHPDILFLDIQIHEKTVFPLLEKLEKRNLNFGVVFITGFKNEYLSEAVESCAMRYKWTYLHKPIVERKMVRALDTFRKKLGDEDDRYIFHQQGEILQLFFDNIIYCETSGNDSIIHTPEKRIVVSESLTTLEAKFPQSRFYRLSGKYLINRKAFVYAKRLPEQKYKAYLKLGRHETIGLHVPREQWGNLRNAFPATLENP